MMAGFSADQAVLQSEQSLMLVLCEEGCKGREIQVVFCTGWLPKPKTAGQAQQRGTARLLGGLAAHSLAYCQNQLIYHPVKKRN